MKPLSFEQERSFSPFFSLPTLPQYSGPPSWLGSPSAQSSKGTTCEMSEAFSIAIPIHRHPVKTKEQNEQLFFQFLNFE